MFEIKNCCAKIILSSSLCILTACNVNLMLRFLMTVGWHVGICLRAVEKTHLVVAQHGKFLLGFHHGRLQPVCTACLIDGACLNNIPLGIQTNFPQRWKDLFPNLYIFSVASFSVLDMMFGSETLNQADVILPGRVCKNQQWSNFKKVSSK